MEYPNLFIMGGLTKKDIIRKKCDKCKKHLVGLSEEPNVEKAKSGVPVWCMCCVLKEYPFKGEEQRKEIEGICQKEF
jgi:RNase P subunit RPR2